MEGQQMSTNEHVAWRRYVGHLIRVVSCIMSRQAERSL